MHALSLAPATPVAPAARPLTLTLLTTEQRPAAGQPLAGEASQQAFEAGYSCYSCTCALEAGAPAPR